MSSQLPTEDPYFEAKTTVRPIISDRAFLSLMGTLKFIAVCAVIGVIVWINPAAIGWAFLFLVAVFFLIVNPF